MELEQLRTRLASAMEARGYSQKSIDGLASVLNRIRRFSENCHGMDTGAILSRYLKHLDENLQYLHLSAYGDGAMTPLIVSGVC